VGRATIFDELEELTDCPWFIEPKDKDPDSEFQRQSTFLAMLRRLGEAGNHRELVPGVARPPREVAA
jgi:hypothetical protein